MDTFISIESRIENDDQTKGLVTLNTWNNVGKIDEWNRKKIQVFNITETTTIKNLNNHLLGMSKLEQDGYQKTSHQIENAVVFEACQSEAFKLKHVLYSPILASSVSKSECWWH